MVVDLLIQFGLNGFKQGLNKNDRLITFEDFAFESDFADIEAIAKQMRERPPRDRYAADGLAGLERADLVDNAPLAAARRSTAKRYGAPYIPTCRSGSARRRASPPAAWLPRSCRRPSGPRTDSSRSAFRARASLRGQA